MQKMTDKQPIVRKSFWKRKAFLFVAIPMSIAMIVFVYFAAVQFQAARRFKAEVERIRLANLPIDADSQNDWFIANTSREHSDAWAEIILLGSVVTDESDVMENLPYIGTAELPLSIDPDQPWANKPMVAQWLEMTKPLIEKIHAVSGSKAPTWQPLRFEGVMTLLEPIQSSRNIARILQVEIEHALYVGDSERAMRGLRSLDGLVYAFDWKICLVTDLVTTALRGIHFSMIQRSLGLDIWTAEQLVELSAQITEKQDVSDRWRTVIAGERGLMFDEVLTHGVWIEDGLPGGIKFFFSIPSVRQRLLFAYSQVEPIADQGIESLAKNAETFEKQFFVDTAGRFSIDDIGVNLFFPAIQAYASALVRDEDSRRLTLTAIAIKRYQLANGQFPERLKQLKDVGLKPSDWTTVPGNEFGYDKEGPAYLWCYWFREPKVMPQERPESEENGMQQLVTIR